MKKLFQFLTSNKVSLVLLLIYAIAMAAATFIENDFGTPRARYLVYDAWWFELIMVWLSINFIAQIKRYQLLSRKKLPVGLFHLGFIVVIIGAGITRYTGFEGWAHIREGQTVSHITTAEPILQVQQQMENGEWKSLLEKEALYKGGGFSPTSYKFEDVSVYETSFYPKARISFDDNGTDTLIQIVVAAPNREDLWLRYGEVRHSGGLSFGFGQTVDAQVRFNVQSDSLTVVSPHLMHVQNMNAEMHGVVPPGQNAGLHLRMIYQFESGAFMVPAFYTNAAIELTPGGTDDGGVDYLTVEVQSNDSEETATFHLKENTGNDERWHYRQVGDTKIRVTFGVKSLDLPFALELRDFEVERYPGSESPSAFSSDLVVHDEERDTSFSYLIYMNNVLDYKGYRFFQASYDTDEKGTVLSVNHDFWGTWITYLGYAMLTIFMIWSLFSPASRFAKVRKALKKSSDEIQSSAFSSPVLITFLLMGSWLLTPAQSLEAQQLRAEEPRQGYQLVIDPAISDAVGKLVVQDLDGRMKPVNTLALELIRKIYGKTEIEVEYLGEKYTLDANQFYISTQLYPAFWFDLPVLKVSDKITRQLNEFTRRDTQGKKHVAFNDLLTDDEDYAVQQRVESASRKKPAEQSSIDKEFLKLDERFNIFYGLATHEFLRIFPHKEDPTHTWYTPSKAQSALSAEDARFASGFLPVLRQYLSNPSPDSRAAALTLVSYVDRYQRIAGEAVYPDQSRIEAELLNNQLSVLPRLSLGFILVGFIWFVLSFTRLFKTFSWYSKAHTTGIVLSIILFIAFTFGMLMRWYIAGRPPWTDGFEMLLFASWGIILMGLFTGQKNLFTLPLSVLFTGVLLFVAYLDWLNPEITNLVPVLKSYWLKIHVAVIVLGYAPLALSALLSLMYLVLKTVDPAQKNNSITHSKRHLTQLSEINITIGLYLLTIGTFLGGIWANESWGRYWGWDPKETWALISIIIYAFVLHLRLVPIKKMEHWFNVATMWAFSSIIMTSFGVNYYLAGMHSYAKGDPIPIPSWVYVATAILLVLTFVSFRKAKHTHSA